MKNRVESLDYLRGFMALSVMLYHYVSWNGINIVYPFGELFLKLGIYAVSCFYVLSGISLAIVYSSKDVNINFIREFSLKRFLRIAPLFYIATTLTILTNYLIRGLDLPQINSMVLNYTLLFSWLSPHTYIATGAWSIGNELVFYSLFPLMIFLLQKGVKNLNLFFGISILIAVVFSLFILDRSIELANQWATYINPLNQLYFFVGGVVIGVYSKFHKGLNKKSLTALITISLLIFVFLPIGGANQIYLVTGIQKLLLSLCIFGICLAAAYWRNTKENKVNKTFKYFGDISYSLYLLHPVIFVLTNFLLAKLSIYNKPLNLIAFIIFTIIFSSISYYIIEKPLTKIGKRNKLFTRKSLSKAS